jgi:hypothetical protein
MEGPQVQRITQEIVQRDQYDRPLINGKPYTRVSTLAKTLDDTSNLQKWSNRMTALGVAQHPTLAADLADKTPDDKRTVDLLVEQAKQHVDAHKGARKGTSIHYITELLDYGEPVDDVDGEDLADARAYHAAVRALNMEPVAAECFVANTHVRAAGTFDRLVKHDAGYVVTDIKTGNSADPKYAAKYNSLAWSMQLATYANAQPWSDGFLRWEDWGFTTPYTKLGVVWYIPRGSGVCHPITVDLEAGWAAAKLAAQVLQIRRSNTTTRIHPAVAAATTR